MAINGQAWLAAVRKEQQKVAEVRHGAVKALGNYARDRVRSRIPPGDSEHSDMAYPFPGYKATGRLKQHYQTFDAKKTPTESRITMGLVRNAGRLARIQSYVHEYGKHISVRRAPWLVFQIRGKWFRAKKVWIRPKAFFELGWKAAHKGAPAILAQYMQANWGK